VHVTAGAVWVGGLAFLLLALLHARGERWSVAMQAVPRFSAAALFAVAALVMSGVVNGFLEVRSWSGLWETTYGVLLLVKVGLVAPLLALGAFNKRLSVPRIRSQLASALDKRRFLAATAAELALFAGVLGVTAVLVAEPPPKALAAAQSGPVSQDVRIGPFDANVVVDPARSGANELHVYLLDRTTGQPTAVDEVRISASLLAARIGPLRLDPTVAGPGHYLVPGATFPLAGAWTIRLDVRRGEFDEWSASVPIPIRKGSTDEGNSPDHQHGAGSSAAR
jgi:copper transport protein